MSYDLSHTSDIHTINSLPLHEFKSVLHTSLNINNSEVFLHIFDLKKLRLLINAGLCIPEKENQWKLYVNCQNKPYLDFLISHGIDFYESDIKNSPYYFIKDMRFFDYFHANISVNNKEQHIIKALSGHLLYEEFNLFLSKANRTNAFSFIREEESKDFVKRAFITANWNILFYLFLNGCSVFLSTRQAVLLDLFTWAKINLQSRIDMERRKKVIRKPLLFKSMQRLNLLKGWGNNIQEIHAKLLIQEKTLFQKPLLNENNCKIQHTKRL